MCALCPGRRRAAIARKRQRLGPHGENRAARSVPTGRLRLAAQSRLCRRVRLVSAANPRPPSASALRPLSDCHERRPSALWGVGAAAADSPAASAFATATPCRGADAKGRRSRQPRGGRQRDGGVGQRERDFAQGPKSPPQSPAPRARSVSLPQLQYVEARAVEDGVSAPRRRATFAATRARGGRYASRSVCDWRLVFSRASHGSSARLPSGSLRGSGDGLSPNQTMKHPQGREGRAWMSCASLISPLCQRRNYRLHHRSSLTLPDTISRPPTAKFASVPSAANRQTQRLLSTAQPCSLHSSIRHKVRLKLKWLLGTMAVQIQTNRPSLAHLRKRRVRHA